jgi:hypothetical protein
MRFKNVGVYLLLLWGLILSPFLLYAETAYAETVVWQAPLIYSPNISREGIYESPQTHISEGIIKSITANWEFEGRVTLEVSANNGLDYHPVINGVPLNNIYPSGNQIKWRAILGKKSKLHKVKITYKDTNGVIGDFGSPRLSGFKFRKPIYIKNPGQELFNSPIKIKIAESTTKKDFDVSCDGNIEADFRDVRFTAADGQTILAHWREEILGTSPHRVATFWVKVPHIPKEGVKIYIYYGKERAQDLLDPEKVFDFFDDFSGEALNPEKWQISSELGGSLNLEESKLILKDTQVISRDFQLGRGILEFKARVEGDAGLISIVRGKRGEKTAFSESVYASKFPEAAHVIAVGGVVVANLGNPIKEGVSYLYQVTARSNELIFERYARGRKEAGINYVNISSPKKGVIGLKAESFAGSEGKVLFDWIRVRRELPSTITFEVGKGEQVSLPIFEGITYSPQGGLVLADKVNYGRYQASFKAEFPIRIITLECEDFINVLVDKDSEERKLSCGEYHYASRGEFKPGKVLVWSVDLSQPQKEIKKVRISYYPGKITVVSPNGGEVLKRGRLTRILWSAQDYEVMYPLKIEYSLDGGKRYKTIVKETLNTGHFYWEVPPEGSNNVILRISDAYSDEVYDTSDRAFRIE